MTYDWLSLQKSANVEFGSRVAMVTDWGAPTPDTDWDVRALVQHVVDEQRWAPHLLAGRSVEQAELDLDPLGDDLLEEWRLYAFAAAVAWRETPPDKPVHLARDTVTAHDYLREQVSDVAIHAWDLARAIGADEALDAGLVEAVWSQFEPQQDTLAMTGLYAAPVPLPSDAPLQWRLLALTGRDPR